MRVKPEFRRGSTTNPDLVRAGARLHQAGCDGMGQAPVVLRHDFSPRQVDLSWPAE